MNTQPFKAILVPLDGSALAEQALPAAMTLADAAGASLHLVTVQPPMPPVMNPDAPIPPDMLEEERARLDIYLQGTARELSARCASPVRHALLFGPPAPAIGAYARANAIDLIVTTTHGRSGLKRLALGSVAEEILRSVAVPVLLFPPETAVVNRPASFGTVLVALDGTAGAGVVLEAAAALGSLAHSTAYTLVHVIEQPAAVLARIVLFPEQVAPDWREQRVAGAHTALQAMAGPLRAAGGTAFTRVLAGRPVSQQILASARACQSDLVVMGTHAPTGAERLLLGSVADDVIRHTDRPVLVVPTRASGRGAEDLALASSGRIVV
ncbi:MAG TPA: universal stress protein [Gemmatimonadales bacterium]